MKVHLIKESTIDSFINKHPGSKIGLNTWMNIIRDADWERPADILKYFRSADLLGNGTERVIFEIAGNNFRMICKYSFGKEKVHLFICWMGTHSEYDKICAERKQYSIHIY